MSTAAAGFVWDPRLASHVYRSDHPLKPWRLLGVHDTLERLGAFALPNARLLQPRLATRDELERIHDPAYVDAIAQASADPAENACTHALYHRPGGHVSTRGLRFSGAPIAQWDRATPS